MTDETKGLGPLRRALRQGEWACVDAKCAYINGEKRHSCEACGKSKPRAKNRVGREIGKDAAEKSKGLFSADDWVCTKCGNVNWARRSVCNICNAPKLGDLEVRTGYGGGYMDREDVEYIERDDDEEFDEFGRKKKKRHKEEGLNADNHHAELRSESTASKELTASKDAVENLNLEDDEEEDGDSDDADLDKYDLTADPDLLNFRVDVKTNSSELHNDRPGSALSSDCSCSCSGGECSCVESDTENLRSKKTEKEEPFRRRGGSRDHDRHRDRSREKDRRGGAPVQRSSRDDRDGARRSKDFERSSRRSSRSPERSRDKDRSYR